MERRQRLSAPEDVRSSIARIVFATSTNINDDLREKTNRKKAAVQQFKDQDLQPHTASPSQKFVQESPIPLDGRSLEMPLEHEQEHSYIVEEVGYWFSVPKDIRDILENAMMRINTVSRYDRGDQTTNKHQY